MLANRVDKIHGLVTPITNLAHKLSWNLPSDIHWYNLKVTASNYGGFTTENNQ